MGNLEGGKRFGIKSLQKALLGADSKNLKMRRLPPIALPFVIASCSSSLALPDPYCSRFCVANAGCEESRSWRFHSVAFELSARVQLSLIIFVKYNPSYLRFCIITTAKHPTIVIESEATST